jgi:hypothetical protein
MLYHICAFRVWDGFSYPTKHVTKISRLKDPSLGAYCVGAYGVRVLYSTCTLQTELAPLGSFFCCGRVP